MKKLAPFQSSWSNKIIQDFQHPFIQLIIINTI